VRGERFPIVLADLFSDSLHDTCRDAHLFPDLGDVEGDSAELSARTSRVIPPVIKSCLERAVEAQSGKLSV
jgi:hypothetical protein